MEPAQVANRFELFRQYEAAGRSPLYDELSAGVIGDEAVQRLICRGPRLEPTLFFAAAQYLGAPYDRGWSGFRPFVLQEADALLAVMHARRTQTNEVARCATLLPVLATLPQPLALLEVGASAGLCLLPDRYAYRFTNTPQGTVELGDADLVLECELRGAVPVPDRLPEIVWRRGIDIDPVDVTDPDACAWLEACVWPDQPNRLDRLRAALAIARRDPPPIDQGDLLERLADVAATAPRDATLVVFHSAVLAYLDKERRREFAGAVTALDCVWVANEGSYVVAKPPPDLPNVDRFLICVDGEVVAFTHGHGGFVEWRE